MTSHDCDETFPPLETFCVRHCLAQRKTAAAVTGRQKFLTTDEIGVNYSNFKISLGLNKTTVFTKNTGIAQCRI